MKNGKRYLFWIGAIFTLIVPVTIGVSTGDSSTTWVAALCGAFVTLLTKIDDLIEISLGPVRAKMREALSEAAASVEQLRTIAGTIAEVALTDLMGGSFFGGMNLKKRLELHGKVIGTLHGLGLSKEKVSEVEASWKKGIGVIYHGIVRSAIEKQSPFGTAPDFYDRQRHVSNEFYGLMNFNNWEVPTPEEMTAFLSERGFLNEEIREWVSDYSHFLSAGEIRRPDVFSEARV